MRAGNLLAQPTGPNRTVPRRRGAHHAQAGHGEAAALGLQALLPHGRGPGHVPATAPAALHPKRAMRNPLLSRSM